MVLSGADLVSEVAAHAAIKVLFVMQGVAVPGEQGGLAVGAR